MARRRLTSPAIARCAHRQHPRHGLAPRLHRTPFRPCPPILRDREIAPHPPAILLDPVRSVHQTPPRTDIPQAHPYYARLVQDVAHLDVAPRRQFLKESLSARERCTKALLPPPMTLVREHPPDYSPATLQDKQPAMVVGRGPSMRWMFGRPGFSRIIGLSCNQLHSFSAAAHPSRRRCTARDRMSARLSPRRRSRTPRTPATAARRSPPGQPQRERRDAGARHVKSGVAA